ncbi:phospholipase D family protein [Microbulbifer litoralis]|uniref:phospholipase D family protein n=1 Tax=Microbulbifer litoralis TaxID=2933965 RepID=UPI0020290B82|nr:phospholipase D family protein [Microbulbifer sp. GX H0434]
MSTTVPSPNNPIPPASNSRLAWGIDREAQGHPADQSGFYLLQEGLSAFVARAVLIEEAAVSLDLKYYIYNDDTSGRIITGLLLRAADRGVRVRLLVDDLGTRVVNPWVLTLNNHPNMEIRVFNPVEGRSGIRRGIEQALNFGRINHRMHNKLLVADGLAILTGGRNIADGYFSKSEVEFLDVDVMAIGAVVSDAADTFGKYWQSPVAVPVSELLTEPDEDHSLERLRELVEKYLQGERQSEFSDALKKSRLAEKLGGGHIPFEWGRATLLADPPEKATDHERVPVRKYPGYRLEKMIGECRQRLQISNPYLIPGNHGVRLFGRLQAQGVQVDILTNGLATNDVAAVHGAYSRYRKPLLQAGVRLWELRPMAEQKQRMHWFKGESRASLHAKTFVLDYNRGFVGSINLDSRSIIYNTEIGLLIENPTINRQLHELFQSWVAPDAAWRLGLDSRDHINWHADDENGGATVDTTDPETRLWHRLLARLLSRMPIESQI